MKTGMEDTVKKFEDELATEVEKYQALLASYRKARTGSGRWQELRGELNVQVYQISLVATSLHELQQEQHELEEHLSLSQAK